MDSIFKTRRRDCNLRCRAHDLWNLELLVILFMSADCKLQNNPMRICTMLLSVGSVNRSPYDVIMPDLLGVVITPKQT